MQESESRLQCALQAQYEMMKNGELCDFRIGVENSVFPVHKMILASRSPYFRTLFSSNMVESEKNLLQLDDIELNIFHALMKYIYTCDFDSPSNEKALKLIMHGEKYGLKDLVDRCEAYLLENINNEIATRCLLAGHLLGRNRLKNEALTLLRQNWEVAFSTNGWDDVLSNQSLITEIEASECSKIKSVKSPVGEINWNPNIGEVRWRVSVTEFSGKSFVVSSAFPLFQDDDLSWNLRIISTACKPPYTVLLTHFGPPAVTPVTYSFAVSRDVEQCTGSIDTSCCFLQNSSCQIVLTTLNAFLNGYISVTLKKADEVAETSSMDYFSEYLEKSCFTDAIVEVRGVEFSVHKIILSAASPIFLEIFQKGGTLFKLNDRTDPTTFKNLLLIIYQSREIPCTVNFDLLDAVKLFKLSNKQINRCRAALFRAMKDTDLIDFLIQANTRQDPILNRMAFKHMAYHFDAVVKLDSWSRLSPDIHHEFFKYLVSNKPFP